MREIYYLFEGQFCSSSSHQYRHYYKYWLKYSTDILYIANFGFIINYKTRCYNRKVRVHGTCVLWNGQKTGAKLEIPINGCHPMIQGRFLHKIFRVSILRISKFYWVPEMGSEKFTDPRHPWPSNRRSTSAPERYQLSE